MWSALAAHRGPCPAGSGISCRCHVARLLWGGTDRTWDAPRPCAEGRRADDRSRGPVRLQPGSRRQVDLLPVAAGFAVSAPVITELLRITERTRVLLAVADPPEAWVTGGGIKLHDRGEPSGTVVAAGTLAGTAVRSNRREVAIISGHHLRVGDLRCFGPGRVHKPIDEGAGPALSVHVCGPRPTTMSYYEIQPPGHLNHARPEVVPPVRPFDGTAAHDQS